MSLPEIPAGTWTVDPVHSTIGFVARHMMVTKVRGTFRDYTAEVTIAENPLDSSVSAVVQMASIDTGNGDRDGHLRTNDFFDVAQYPTMTLESTGFTVDGDDYKMQRRPDDQGRHQAGHLRRRVRGRHRRPVGRHPGRRLAPRRPSTARTGGSSGTPRSRPAA